jgi:hypothetical protein
VNPYTGHLVAIPTEKQQKMLREMFDRGYEPVPPELERAARKKLAGRSEATVSLTSGGKLARWAAGKRNERKVRNRMVKESRRKNRGR